MRSFLFCMALMLHINGLTSQPLQLDFGPPDFGPPDFGPPEFPSSYYHKPALHPLPGPRRRPSHRDHSQFDSRDRLRSRNYVIEPYRPSGGPRIMRDPIDTIGRHDIRPRVRDSYEPLDRQRSRTYITDRDYRRRRTDLIDPIGGRRSSSRLSDPYDPLPFARPSSSSRLSDPYDPLPFARPSSSSRLSDPYDPLHFDRPSSSSRLSDPYEPLPSDRPSSSSRLSDPYEPLLSDRPISSSRLADPYEPLPSDRPSSSSRLSDRYEPLRSDRSSSSSRLSDLYEPLPSDRPSSSSRLSDAYEPLPLDRPSSRRRLSDRRDPYDSRPFSRRYDPYERPLTGSSRTSDFQQGVRRDRLIRRPIYIDSRPNPDRTRQGGDRTFSTRDARRSRGRRVFVDNSPRPDHDKSTRHVNRLLTRLNPRMISVQTNRIRYPSHPNQ